MASFVRALGFFPGPTVVRESFSYLSLVVEEVSSPGDKLKLDTINIELFVIK